MKRTYAAPKLSSHGTVAEITNFFGKGNGDVLTGPDNSVAATASGSIDACAEAGRTCIPK